MAVVLGTSSGFVRTAPTADPAGTDTVIDGASVVTKHTAPAGARTITEIGWYRGSGTNAANFEVALYSDVGGVASARLNVDATNSSTSTGWITTAVSWSITPGTAYWLAVQMDAHTGSSNIDTEVSGGAGIDRLTGATTLADPYGGGAVLDADGMYAIYALVTGTEVAVTAGLGEVTIEGFAPTVQTPRNITPDVGAVALEGFVPTFSTASVGSSFNGTPDVGAATLDGFAPTVETPRNVTPDVGAVELTGFEPTIQTPRNIVADVGAATFTGFEPTVEIAVTVLPDVGAVTVEGFAPTVETPVVLLPDVGVLSWLGYEPTVVGGSESGTTVLPETGTLVCVGFAPTFSSVSSRTRATMDGTLLLIWQARPRSGTTEKRKRKEKKEEAPRRVSRLAYEGRMERQTPLEDTPPALPLAVAFLAMEWMDE